MDAETIDSPVRCSSLDEFDRLIDEHDAHPDHIEFLQKKFQTRPTTVGELLAFNPKDDPDGLIGERFLCRGGSIMLNGPTGVGKSSLTTQMAIAFSLGREAFGLTPRFPLRMAIIQAENDEGDLAEMVQGVMTGQSINEEDAKTVDEHLRFFSNTTNTSWKFVQLLYAIHHIHRPDIIIADPLFSFIGGEVTNQGNVSEFLRQGVSTFLAETGCAVVFVHHTKKPNKDDVSGSTAYAGYGSVELANWARAVVNLERCGSIFKLVFSKRGKRTGIALQPGSGDPVKYLKHSDYGICWEETERPENEGRNGSGQRPGTFQRNYSTEALAEHYDPDLEWKTNKLNIHMATGCSPRTLDRRKGEIESFVSESSENQQDMVGHGSDTEETRS